jgi:positive regulator of sigma E activity
MRFACYLLGLIGLMFASFLAGHYGAGDDQQTACIWGAIAAMGFLSLLLDYRVGKTKTKEPNIVVTIDSVGKQAVD